MIVLVIGRLAATGRLPRNPLAGIRIPSTMRSDAAWRAGHSAAASALTTAGVGPVVAAAVIAVKRPGPEAEKLLLRVGSVWLVSWLGAATLQASRAARETSAS
jgi:uncharacterized membrane protein